MQRLIQRFKSRFIDATEVTDRINVLNIELAQRGIHFGIEEENEGGEKVFFAHSVNYPKGSIMASGKTKVELANNLRDAIFTAFEIPAPYCNAKFIVINFDGSLADQNAVAVAPSHVTT